MRLRIGTFNLNNLFSRWNYKGELVRDGAGGTWRVETGREGWERRFKGSVVQPKPTAATERIAARIKEAAPQILAVQEVEDRDTLRAFNQRQLGGRFSECVLVEGNDSRLIDVGLMSQLPVGEVRSFQRWRHPELPKEPLFRRDLLLVEILSPDRRERLLWVAVAHLKSQLVDWSLKDEAARRAAVERSDRVRRLEAEGIALLLRRHVGEGERLLLCGDLNDVPESLALAPLRATAGAGLGLVNLLGRHQDRAEARWTVTHKATGLERAFLQYDYLLANGPMAGRVDRAWVERRKTRPGEGDGSDHDPVMCEAEL